MFWLDSSYFYRPVFASRYQKARRRAGEVSNSKVAGTVSFTMASGEKAKSSTSTKAEKVQDNSAFEYAARAGHVGTGLLHIIIGYIVIQLAFGGGGSADQSGALGELAEKPGGSIALWVAVFAFVALALWRVFEAVVGKKSDEDEGDLTDRAKAIALAIVYFAFAWTTFGFARGAGKSSSEQNASMTARLMENGFGKFVLIVVGLVVMGVGGYHIYKGVTKKFLDNLEGSTGKGVERLGVAGYCAKGLALVGAGGLVIVAVFTSDPSKATGIDGAVKTLGAQPYGPVLLVLAGIGIGLYGIYAFVLARYAKM